MIIQKKSNANPLVYECKVEQNMNIEFIMFTAGIQTVRRHGEDVSVAHAN